MSLDIGTNRILQIKYVGTFFPIGCITDNSFSESSEMLDTTVRTNVDGWVSSIPVKQTYNISFNGLLELVETGNILTYATIETLKRDRVKIDWRILSSGGGNIDTGSGFITSLGNSAAIDEFVSFTGEIIGIGVPFSTSVPPVVANKWVEIDDAWVYKGTNINVTSVEVGDMIRRYQTPIRYIHARVNALPYTVDANLSFFEDIQII